MMLTKYLQKAPKLSAVFIVFFLPLLTGCGADFDRQVDLLSGPNAVPEEFFDPDLNELLQEYLTEAAAQGLDVSSNLQELKRLEFREGLSKGNLPSYAAKSAADPNLAGLCVVAELEGNSFNRKTEVFRTISIDGAFKNVPDSSTLRYLLWHELGHCLFDAPHALKKTHLRAKSLGLADFNALADSIAEQSDASEYDDEWKDTYESYYLTNFQIMSPNLSSDERYWETYREGLVDQYWEDITQY